MAFGKILFRRLFNRPQISNASLTDCRISSSIFGHSNPTKTMVPDPGDSAISRRFLHKKAIFNTALLPELRSLPVGEKLIDKLRGMDIVKDRINLDGLIPPVRSELTEEKFSVEDARKLLKLAQLEMVKSKLKLIEKSCISKAEFVRICSEACSDQDEGLKIAKVLDDSGTVIILGNVVFLRPEQGDLKLG